MLESNRIALRRLLNEKIDAIRKPFRPECKMGETVRRQKLAEALRIDLQTGEAAQPHEGTFPFLQGVAIARNISLRDAAALVRAKARETDEMLQETERFRLLLGAAIDDAQTQDQMLEIRRMLIDDIYPKLAEKFAYLIEEAAPEALDVPIPASLLEHERARLREQLRDAVNRRRQSTQSAYIRNGELRRHKLRLAKIVLTNVAAGLLPLHSPSGVEIDFRLISNLAEARGVEVSQAAEILIRSALAEDDLLQATEQEKDTFLQRIGDVGTFAELNALDADLIRFTSA